MNSQKPYLIRALYEWCQDNEYTPYLVAHVNAHTMVPKEYVQDSQIVLDISFAATKDILIDNEWITFRASFNGTPQDIAVPINNVLAIFAKETGQGMQFNLEPMATKKPSGLRLVK